MTARRYDANSVVNSENRIKLIYDTDYWDQPLSGFATIDGKLTMFRWPFDSDKIIVADPPCLVKRILLRINLEYIRLKIGNHWDHSAYKTLPFSFKRPILFKRKIKK